ncbi:MAG: ATP-binding protein [Sphingobacterium sp.]|jgi:predicted ATPase|nr:ATP-binding protein [Sphingobacterium sp.]
MSKIRIKNFGPIKEGVADNGWIDIKKVTVFIGNQGSGKSTIAKLISTFTWIEKALVRGDYDITWFEQKDRFKNRFLKYHRLENYFENYGNDDAHIEYEGDAFRIVYKSRKLSITEKSIISYPLPQIMYVPAERNFIAYVKTPKELKLSSEPLTEFLTEFDNAKNEMKGLVKLPINKTEVEYDQSADTLELQGKGYRIKLAEASSGFQSLVPVYLVSSYLANMIKKQTEDNKEPMSTDEIKRFKAGVAEVWNNADLTDEQRRIALSVLSARFNKTAFVNIVEEPEQNLFPSSQKELLHGLLAFNRLNSGNKLIITTHSPYLINYLTLSVKAGELKNRIKDKGYLEELNSIIPIESSLNIGELIVYQMDEETGSVYLLETLNGLPSDDNELNISLDESNELFAQLLEIQQRI